MSRFATIAVLACAVAGQPAGLGATESRPFELSVIVDGLAQAEYPGRNLTYVEAIEGKSFSLRVSNPTSQRVAVALSVDGRNVIDAKRTSASAAAKWILWPGQTIDIPGWQVSSDSARRFFFTETHRSYAKWLGDTSNVGLIEAVFFRERRPAIVAQEPTDQVGPRFESDARRGAPRAAPKSASPLEAGAAAGGERVLDEKDSYAATGIGQRTLFSVDWVAFDHEPSPAARIALRYEFRRELVRLGVLPRGADASARDLARGFVPEYAPDPDRARAQ